MSKEKRYLTVDGNTAAAYTSYAFTEVSGIYPITPSSPMADAVDHWAQEGRNNIFGQTVKVTQMQSEAGAAGTVHGALQAGALACSYTSSQGLLLMIPDMYKMAGELLPAVVHVAARAVGSHALSIFGDHSDVMACRQTGFAMLSSASVQEATDMAAVAHLAAIKGRIPFMHFFDGFRTSHEIQKIEVQDYEDYAKLLDRDALKAFRDRSLSPNHPTMRGSAQNPDIFFQGREASNSYYNAIPEIVENYMLEINELTGRDYHLFNYYGAPDADKAIICMGSVYDTACEVADYLNSHGEKVGVLNVHLYRPFSMGHFLKALPETVKKIAVLDRTKECGSIGEPLFLDVVAAFNQVKDRPSIIGGRYGLGSKDTTPNQIRAVFKNLDKEEPQHPFTIGINDDVTHLSLAIEEKIDVRPEGTFEAQFWGFGSDGTVGANKNSIKIIGDHTDLHVQAYFSYDSKKSGGVTISNLRFGKEEIHEPYLIEQADFVACHNQAYVKKYDMVKTLKPGGSFLLNTNWPVEDLDSRLPAKMKRYIADNDINFYVIDAINAGKEIGLGGRINTICQAAFFKILPIIPLEEAVQHMKDAAKKSYGHKGEKIVLMNEKAIEAGVERVQKIAVPENWKDAQDEPQPIKDEPDFVKNIADMMNRMEGDQLPVSAFLDRADGTFPQGTTQFEKREIAVQIPIWNPEECIQCNQCSFVCPHAAIRPFLVTEEEAANAPEGMGFIDGMRPYKDSKYRIQVSAADCTGCGICVLTCPARKKAIEMRNREDHLEENENWDYMIRLPHKENPVGTNTVKGSQFEQPLFEFSGACAGCGETPYIKLATQVVGDRMQIANATGCTSIYGGSAPSAPYTTNDKGFGPSWANSLLEDNAEFGFGMHHATKQLRERTLGLALQLLKQEIDEDLRVPTQAWVDGFNEKRGARNLAAAFSEALEAVQTADQNVQNLVSDILQYKDYLMKRSTWMFGGDGWAYDIDFGGIDHVLASGEDINILVLDTEVYSNTGGQVSKSSNIGAIAEFASGGKPVKKKDLGMMMMNYGYVYVAQIAMGANPRHTLKVLSEAEAYDGPSIVIAYSPCINHGIKCGLTVSQSHEKDAVDVGYWHLYRFNPEDKAKGKNPFTLDSKEPQFERFQDFLMEEVRYSSLYNLYDAEHVQNIFDHGLESAKDRYQSYVRMASYTD
ncbi:pyruvate ferredoxin/flavodoxin oxidoreductase [Trichococcus palustris]|uniref:Pyruvate ferredoxin/flavodoxin oxidoreductase n=1 Tax=Trichococcus palustris TaxID=140314 RepID=A0A143YQU4_9LACT|nr:pyruvate:ferredoxin (flavodoxin) oxidoreductase [Trichococcus palustris]CZQ95330.1 pyruvate ferredoxin/flavodoxin oxidoreductase [Trichococcus palustris]SFK96336.1 pyruvate-ferredoxin/flavodoxin oxidoreductase [Trichococcus palustris]